MEAIIPALTAMIGGSAAAGTAAAGTAAVAGTAAAGTAAAGTAAASAGSLATAMQIVQGGMSVFSALAGIAGANAAADDLSAQAASKNLEADRAEADKLRETARKKRELARVTGENDVAFAAAGIDISQGVAADSRRSEAEMAANDLTISRADAEARKAMLRMQSSGLRQRARSKRRGGVIKGLGSLSSAGLNMATA